MKTYLVMTIVKTTISLNDNCFDINISSDVIVR